MPSKKLPVLLIALLFKATGSLAQSQPSPTATPARDPDYEEVSLPVPRAVSLLADVAQTLFSRDNEGKGKVQDLIDRRHARSEKRDQNLTITVPRNGLTRTLGLVE
jgi:hypothetical protein